MYKPFDPDILRAKVAVFVELFRKTEALEQRTAELTTMAAELEWSREHFRALIEDASDLTLIVEEDAIIRYASPSVERILGYSREQIAGRRLTDFLHPDDVATLHSDIAVLLETGRNHLAYGPPVAAREWRLPGARINRHQSPEDPERGRPGGPRPRRHRTEAR